MFINFDDKRNRNLLDRDKQHDYILEHIDLRFKLIKGITQNLNI